MNNQEHARMITPEGDAVTLESVKASGDLRGVLLDMVVEQRFRNASSKNIEVVYSFPLPWSAVLLGVEVQLGERKLSGTVIEKAQAETGYEGALAEGHAAILLEQNHDHSYTLNLGNLAAQEACVITLRYAQTLQFEQHGLRLLIPTVIAPRYGDPVRDGGLQAHQAPVTNLAADYPFDIALRLHGELAKARVASPSHPISVAPQSADDCVTVSLGRRGALDRDFVLVLDQLAQASTVVLAPDGVAAGQVVALASFCPRIAAHGPATTEIKLLVDCSGSMAGDSIDAARRALQSIVLQLNTGDRFSLSRFGSTVMHRSRGLWDLTDVTRLAAQRWIGNLQADLGGTEMEEALISTFALASGTSSDVLVVTDGEISAIDRTIASAKASGHRVFVVGIGSSPAESHLRRLAESTGGACDFVAPGEAVEPAVLRMFARLRSPRLDALRIEWPGGVQPAWFSAPPVSVFDGDTVNLFALLAQAPEGELRLTGIRPDGGTAEVIGSVRFGPAVETLASLGRMAAHVRVAQYRQQTDAESAKQATRLAVDYQLVTDHTSYLLVAERAANEKALDMPELHKIAQMLPAGWGGSSTVYGAAAAMPAAAAASMSMRTRGIAPPGSKRLSKSSFLYRHQAQDERAQAMDLSTPAGLGEWLRHTPVASWPTTYAELAQHGVLPEVLDWLELVMAPQLGRPLTEEAVVASFLHMLVHAAPFEQPVQEGGVLREAANAVRRIKGALTGTPADAVQNVDLPFAELLAAGLQGITADRWPDQIYAMHTA